MRYSRKGFWLKPRYQKKEETALNETRVRTCAFNVESRIRIKDSGTSTLLRVDPGTRGKWAQGLKLGSSKNQYTAVSQRNFYLRIGGKKHLLIIFHPPLVQGCPRSRELNTPTFQTRSAFSLNRFPPASHGAVSKKAWKILDACLRQDAVSSR